MITNIALLFSIFVIVAGQLLIKNGLNTLGQIDFASGIVLAYSKIFFCPSVLFGLSLYISGVLAWKYVLTKMDLSYAYPFLALTYVLVAFSSMYFLNEQISPIRWIGIVTICFGVVLITQS